MIYDSESSYVGHVEAVGPASGEAAPELGVLTRQGGGEVVKVPEPALDEVWVDLSGGGEHLHLVQDTAEVGQLGAQLLPVLQPRLQLLCAGDTGVGHCSVVVGRPLAVTETGQFERVLISKTDLPLCVDARCGLEGAGRGVGHLEINVRKHFPGHL